EARRLVDAALAAAPGHVPALIVSARLAAAEGAASRALELLDQALHQDPRNAEAHLVKSEVQQRLQQDADAARATLENGLRAIPGDISMRSALIAILLARGDIAAARPEVAELAKHAPGLKQTKLYQAQLAYIAKDYSGARPFAQQLLQAAPADPIALQLAGAIEYRLGALQQAESLFDRALQHRPALRLARVLLIHTYLRTAQPDKALETLQPLLSQPDPDAAVLSWAAEAQLQAGRAADARQMLARAAKLAPDDTRLQVVNAIQASQGNGEATMAVLQQLAAHTKEGIADMALVSNLLGRNEYDKALRALDAWERKAPEQPLVQVLRGRVKLALKDPAAARASFQKALMIDPGFLPAAGSLAALDVAEGKLPEGRGRFESLLKANPKNVQAMVGLSDLLAAAGESAEEATRLLNNAVSVEPTSPQLRLKLVSHLLAVGDTKAALTAAAGADSAIPDQPDLIEMLGRMQLAAGQTEQAVYTFSRLTTLRPMSPAGFLGAADAAIAKGDREGAARHLKRALEVSPQLLAAQRALIGLALADGKPALALQMAEIVKTQRPKSGIGWQLEGEVEMWRKNWGTAIPAFRSAMQRGGSAETAALQHEALRKSGDEAGASRLASEWMNAHPADAGFLFRMATWAQDRNDWTDAEAKYRHVLDLQPRNALAANNLAWALMKQSKTGAVSFAEKANRWMPNRPALMDTLAQALAAENDLDKALLLQRKAVEADPKNVALRIGLARIYLKTGDKARARDELRPLAAREDQFPERAEVAELMRLL
ncbi:MAG TPA: XrtA/PEP-CTERM system TPR-repeat protein PrsT, partial [Burkholderiaceae bacterium]|nr:XrtA/PEP-CTERM system TPR-repeat protein PrsT [Burkholderiaceae bacterium]